MPSYMFYTTIKNDFKFYKIIFILKFKKIAFLKCLYNLLIYFFLNDFKYYFLIIKKISLNIVYAYLWIISINLSISFIILNYNLITKKININNNNNNNMYPRPDGLGAEPIEDLKFVLLIAAFAFVSSALTDKFLEMKSLSALVAKLKKKKNNCLPFISMIILYSGFAFAYKIMLLLYCTPNIFTNSVDPIWFFTTTRDYIYWPGLFEMLYLGYYIKRYDPDDTSKMAIIKLYSIYVLSCVIFMTFYVYRVIV